MNNHRTGEVKLSNGCFRTTQSIELMGPSMAPWTSATWNISARLERELRAPLFDRNVTPIALTEHGAALRAGAQRILHPQHRAA